MLIYLRKKRGGLFAIDAADVGRIEDLTEDMERESRIAMEGRNQTARAMGWDEQTYHTTAGGARINGAHDVLETTEQIRALLANMPSDGAVKFSDAERVDAAGPVSVLTPAASDRIAGAVVGAVDEWKRAGALLATTIHDVGSVLKGEIVKPLREAWAAGGSGPLRDALWAWTEAAKRIKGG